MTSLRSTPPFLVLITLGAGSWSCASVVVPQFGDAAGADASSRDTAHPTPGDAERRCTTRSDCGHDEECVFAPMCPSAGGTCETALMCTEPVPFCGCDGSTYLSCAANQPLMHAGECWHSTPATRYPGAVMVWEEHSGFAGTGRAIVVRSDGSVDAWASTQRFEPDMPPPMPTTSMHLLPPQIDDLFGRWEMTMSAGLPHAPGGTNLECDAELAVRTCADCPFTRIRYLTPAQLSPEMEPVFQWFDARSLGSLAPREYCTL
jgi:hypothetical protein